MKIFEGLFGQYVIRVTGKSIEEAKVKIRKKFNSYKDGSKKKEYIRSLINKDFPVIEVIERNGFYIPA